MSLKSHLLAVGLAVAVLASPTRAGEVDRYLPADTEVYSVVNIRQILNSALVRKVGVDNIRALLNQNDEVTGILKDLGLDPLKDVDRIISTGPASGEQDKGLVIVHGRFDIDKFRSRAKKEAKDNKEVVKPIKIGGEECYEVVINDANLSLFVGFVSDKTILAAMSKDYLGDALKVKPTDRAMLKSKAFQEMLEKLDDKQSMAMVLNGEVLKAIPQPNVRDSLSKLTTASGGITLTDGIKIELSGSTKEARDAVELKDTVSSAINAGIGLLGFAGKPELNPLIDFLKSVRTTSKDKTITIKAELTGEDLNKLLPKSE